MDLADAPQDFVTVNWIFLDAKGPQVRCIDIPRALYTSPVQDSQCLFAKEVAKAYHFKADPPNIKFFKPINPISIRTRDWKGAFGNWDTVTERIPLPVTLSEILGDDLDEENLHLIIKANPAQNTQEHVDEERDTAPDFGLPEFRRFARALKPLRGHPSEHANFPAYASNQSNPNTAIYNGRPAPDAEFEPIAPPIHIFHPIFERFHYFLGNSELPVTKDDVVNTHEFMAWASSVDPSGSARAKALRKLLGPLLLAGIPVEMNDDKSVADNVITFSLVKSQYNVKILILELKPEYGTGGCDMENQAGLNMRHYWTQEQSAYIRDRCCCPTFFLASGGPWLGILGGVFTDKFIVQRLTNMLSVCHSSTYSDSQVWYVARYFVSLRKCLRELCDFYQDVPGRPPINLNRPTDPHPRLYPSPSSYTRDGQTIEFKYLRALEDDSACVTFLAQNVDTKEDIVVKFVNRYGREVHHFLAERQLAPRLHYFGPMYPGNQSPAQHLDNLLPNMQMVVMDYISPGPHPPDAQKQIASALELLHMNGFVLGDLRAPNILFDDEGDLKLIDMDWAGRYQEVFYPILSGWRPEGARSFGLIHPEHDTKMLAELYSNGK